MRVRRWLYIIAEQRGLTMSDDRAEWIEGTVRLPDGTVSNFSIYKDGNWSQWGPVDKERLGRSVPIIEAAAEALQAKGLLTSDYDEHE